jgi:hypothetical protein
MTRNGAPFGLPPGNTIQDLSLAGFPDFRVDTFAVMSYSDAGQNPPQFSGSILAQGVVDNITWTVPESPVSNLRGQFTNDIWQVTFTGRTNWIYALERTLDLESWIAVATNMSAYDGLRVLQDPNVALSQNTFYRIRAERP